jgi:hypothetical protein
MKKSGVKNSIDHGAPKTTAQSLGSLLKSARDIMRKDKGLNGDLDRLPMLTWIMFLKFLDDLELQRAEEAKLAGKPHPASGHLLPVGRGEGHRSGAFKAAIESPGSLIENHEGCCGEGFWLWTRRRGRSIPAAGCNDRANAGHGQKTRRPEGFRAKGRLASLLLSRRSTKDILLRRASPSDLFPENSAPRGFQSGSSRWRDWAANPQGVTGDELLAFINNEETVLPDGERGQGLFVICASSPVPMAIIGAM